MSFTKAEIKSAEYVYAQIGCSLRLSDMGNHVEMIARAVLREARAERVEIHSADAQPVDVPAKFPEGFGVTMRDCTWGDGATIPGIGAEPEPDEIKPGDTLRWSADGGKTYKESTAVEYVAPEPAAAPVDAEADIDIDELLAERDALRAERAHFKRMEERLDDCLQRRIPALVAAREKAERELDEARHSEREAAKCLRVASDAAIAARARADKAEAEVGRLKAENKEFASLLMCSPFQHYHFDEKGTSGTNCQACIDHRKWRARRDAALCGEEASDE